MDHMKAISYVNISRDVHISVEYGVPQRRERFISIWLRSDIAHLSDWFRPFEKAGNVRTLRDALKAGSLYGTDVPASEGASYAVKKASVLNLVPPGGNWRDLPEEVAKGYMKRAWEAGGGRTGFARRIAWDEPCPTILTAPTQMQTDRCHPDEVRPFTVRE